MEHRRELTQEELQRLPIGVFDSGVGGISVLRELLDVLPQEQFYYVGDELNAPYGTKEEQQIRELTLQHVGSMVEKGIKALVVACNTATSAAIAVLRETYPDMPVVGIEPALKPAVQIGTHPTVIVMATPGTVHGKKFLDLMDRFASQARIIPLGCPGLMEFVERGELSGAALHAYLEDLFAPYREQRIDAIVLGCTHYPFVRRQIRAVAGPEPEILDGSLGCASQMQRVLQRQGLLRTAAETTDRGSRVVWHMTLPGREALCQRLLEEER